jgi:pimeloyl-ACP methyl ester carboxylesterase
VLDTVGSERASILGVSEGSGVAALFASTHPERTGRVVFYGSVGRLAGVEHPLGLHDDELLRQFNAALASGWGSDDVAAAMGAPLWAPSMTGDQEFVRWMGRYMRQSVSRNEIEPLLTAIWGYELSDVFPAVRVPTLVLGRRDDRLGVHRLRPPHRRDGSRLAPGRARRRRPPALRR